MRMYYTVESVFLFYYLNHTRMHLLRITEVTVRTFPWNKRFNETDIFTRKFKAVHRNRIHQSLENYILEI